MRQEMKCTQSCTDTQREMSALEITWDAGISPYSLLLHLYFNNIKICGLVIEIIRFLRYTIRPGQTIRFQSTTLWTMLCDAILLTIFENVGKTPIQDVKKLLLTCIVFLNHWNGIFALCLQYSLIFSNCNGKRMWAEMVLMCVVFSDLITNSLYTVDDFVTHCPGRRHSCTCFFFPHSPDNISTCWYILLSGSVFVKEHMYLARCWYVPSLSPYTKPFGLHW